MPGSEVSNVTMRIRLGDSELEVTGPVDFVEKKISEFVENHKHDAPVSRTLRESAMPASEPAAPTKKMSAAQFFRKINPRTDVDKTLAAGYYLETHASLDSFTAADIREIIHKQAKTPPPKNTSEAINKNIRKGFMMSAGDKDGRMAFVLTSDGEEQIRSLLVE